MRKNFGVVSGVLFAVFVLCTSASAMTISINGSGGAVVTDVSSAIRDEVKGDVFDFIEDGEFYGVELSVEASTITIDYEVGGEEAYRGYFFLKRADFFLEWEARYEEVYEFERPRPHASHQESINDGGEADLDSRPGYIKAIAAISTKELDIPSYEGSWEYQGYGQMEGYTVEDSGTATISVNGDIITEISCSGTKVSGGVSENYSFSQATNSRCSYGAFQFQKDGATYEVYMYDKQGETLSMSVESGAGTNMDYTMYNKANATPTPFPEDPTPAPQASSGSSGGGCSLGFGLPALLLIPFYVLLKK